MANQLQIRANRRNARKSTGPKSDTGKSIAAKNALLHGVFSTAPLLPGEDPQEFAALREGYLALYCPTNQNQHFLVDRLVQSAWRLTRLLGLEIRIVHSHYDAAKQNYDLIRNMTAAVRILYTKPSPSDQDLIEPPPSSLAEPDIDWEDPVARAYMRDSEHGDSVMKFSRYQAALEKSYYRALQELEKIQSPRRNPRNKSTKLAPTQIGFVS